MENVAFQTRPDTTKLVKQLAKLLADEYVLSAKTRKAHWNAEGPDFYEKHMLFEKQYKLLDEAVDAIAEHIRVLGHYVPATLGEYLALTTLSEKTPVQNDVPALVNELRADHIKVTVVLRHIIKTLGSDANATFLTTTDLLTALLRQHETTAWMLGAHCRPFRESQAG